MAIKTKLFGFYIFFILFVIFLSINAYKNKPTTIDNPSLKDYKGQAMVTFSYDDGLISNYDYALPLHEKYNIPATFNVVAGRVENKFFHDRFFDKDMVVDSYKRGIEIASHSYYHDAPLTDKTDEEIYFEITESKNALESVLKDKVDVIAIPFSQYDDRVRAITSNHYKGVRVYGETSNNPKDIDYHFLNSYAVTNKTTFEDLKGIIDQAVNDKTWVIIMLHGTEYDNDLMYEITPKLLEEVLAYVNDFDKSILLPVNTSDGISFIQETSK